MIQFFKLPCHTMSTWCKTCKEKPLKIPRSWVTITNNLSLLLPYYLLLGKTCHILGVWQVQRRKKILKKKEYQTNKNKTLSNCQVNLGMNCKLFNCSSFIHKKPIKHRKSHAIKNKIKIPNTRTTTIICIKIKSRNDSTEI